MSSKNKNNGAAFCLIYASSTDRFLVEQRGINVNHPLTFGLFGGAIDDGESPKQAICRELKEETGLVVSKFDYKMKLGRSPVHLYAKIIRREFIPNLSWESAAYRWVDDVTSMKPLHKKMKQYVSDIRNLQAFIRYLDHGEILEKDEV